MVVHRDPSAWLRYADVDRRSTFLRDTSGAVITYAELETSNGDRYATQVAPDHLAEQAAQTELAIERLRADVAEARPDVFIVIGDDQLELHDFDNMPALGVFYGPEVVMAIHSRFATYYEDLADIMPTISAGYGMDQPYRWPAHPPLALHLIDSLIGQSFDLSALKEVPGGSAVGVGHAFGVVYVQLMGDTKVPLIPLYVNNYWPPNQLPPARCLALGHALRTAIESFPEALRVAVVASGGLSHFVTDEVLDRRILDALRAGDIEALGSVPVDLLKSGNSEIRNWMTLAAACRDRPVAWDEYIPVYRSPVGTGVGLAFLRY
jgi:3-O-methylgallate 3,4-dioxygenase